MATRDKLAQMRTSEYLAAHPADPDALISVRGLKKYYNKGAIKALDGVDVDIIKARSSSSSAPPAAARARCCAR